jgi:7-keto-8-aminopelargonate synthetase-like enzyme
MRIPFFSLDRHVSQLRDRALEAVDAVLRSQAFANGPEVARFEAKLAEFLGVSRVVCVNSGTSALHAALICAGVEPGSEVVTRRSHLDLDRLGDLLRRSGATTGRRRGADLRDGPRTAGGGGDGEDEGHRSRAPLREG